MPGLKAIENGKLFNLVQSPQCRGNEAHLLLTTC